MVLGNEDNPEHKWIFPKYVTFRPNEEEGKVQGCMQPSVSWLWLAQHWHVTVSVTFKVRHEPHMLCGEEKGVMWSCFVAVDGITVLSLILPLGTLQTPTRETGRKQNPNHSIPLQVVRKDCPAGWCHTSHFTSDRCQSPQLQRKKKG